MDHLDRVPDIDTSWMNDEFRMVEKDVYFDALVEDAIKLVKGGKLYGFPIDVGNPRDVIAAVYANYLFKEQMSKGT